MSVREMTEQLERDNLSPRAARAAESRGRIRDEAPCPLRTHYQRDRDRILHSNAFRRLMHKTQVFLSPEGDHYRTRLTHTLEVSQIARTIARGLRLNEDLTEAIALGHDLGHTPFGHAGERALAAVCPHGFRHNLQSVRVVTHIENEGRGLNLTAEVLDGIATHSTSAPTPLTLEGRVVRYADKIAYMNHDIEDAIRAGVLTEQDLPEGLQVHSGRPKSVRITRFVDSIIKNSGEDIRMDDETQAAYDTLRRFMFETIYVHPIIKAEEHKAVAMVRALYRYFMENPGLLPPRFAAIARETDTDQAVCDYISGMSDRFALMVYTDLFLPKAWQG